MKNQSKRDRMTMMTSEGEAEAVRAEAERWEINTPWTSRIFHGTKAQALAELRKLVQARGQN